MPEEENYLKNAEDDAKEAAQNFLDEIIDAIYDEGEAPTDLYDISGGDSYHHESHVDKSYSLKEAAELLDQLDDYEETDEGLWEGQSPREAIATQAAYTYGHAVMGEFGELMENLNSELAGVKEELEAAREAEKEKLEAEIERLEEGLEVLEEESPWKAETEKRIEEIKEALERVEDDDALEEAAKRRIRRDVEIALGLRRKPKPGTKEWMPGA